MENLTGVAPVQQAWKSETGKNRFRQKGKSEMQKDRQKEDNRQERLTDDAKLLNQYLNQYRFCIGRKRLLERRRAEIIMEFGNPLKAVPMDGMPKGNRHREGCAALSLRLDEVDTRIKEQKENAEKVLVNIMNIIDFLPESSLERAILENRYLDRYNWEQVCRENHISRTPAMRKWRRGLHKLLDFKKIKQILEEYKNSLQD